MGFDTDATELMLGLGAVLALVSLVRGWGPFLDADFTVADRRVAMQASIFLVPPAVVLFHELGHAAAVGIVGAQMIDFHYGLFEGSVTYTGATSAAQIWFVAIAGNLVSIGAGLGMIVAGVFGVRVRRSLRYLLLLGGLIEALFALIGYPVLSEAARFGDWISIYDFRATPALSWATLVVHVGAVALLGQWWRTSLRRTLFGITHGEESRLAELTTAIRDDPAALEPRVALANLFAGYGELKLASQTLDSAVTVASRPVRLHLARARLNIHQSKWTQALVATQAGLATIDDAGGDYEVVQQLWANQGVALAQLGRWELALGAFGHVDEALLADPRVRYCRGLARIGAGDEAGGRADLSAVATGPTSELLRRWATARLAGRDPDPPDDSDRPAWARRAQSPPAPISGV